MVLQLFAPAPLRFSPHKLVDLLLPVVVYSALVHCAVVFLVDDRDEEALQDQRRKQHDQEPDDTTQDKTPLLHVQQQILPKLLAQNRQEACPKALVVGK